MRFVLAMSALLSLSLFSATVHAETADTPVMTNAVSAEAPVVNGTDSDVKAIGTEPEKTVTKVAVPKVNAPEGLTIAFKDGRLSVNAKDQPFGVIIGAIANAAGFEVDISDDVYKMTLSTRFQNSNLKRGILRLLSLIEQRNYTIDYAPDGSIKKLEVFGDLTSGRRTLTGPQTPAVTTPAQPVRSTTPPPTPPVLVIKDSERKRRMQPATSKSPAASEATTEPSEPDEEKEILELDYSIRSLPTEQQVPDTNTGKDNTSGDTTSDDSTGGDTTPPDDSIEPEIIPEGDIPPEDQLLNAPIVPQSSSPAKP